ncbi:hypothetical protein [Pelagibacterium halotolerans]|uniref:hypothetical protein n=1 Tax=Pelagibacterium halotolerans TaxID=531813 RepID=UPI0038502B42
MRIYLLSAAIVALATPALADDFNEALVLQGGIDNYQSTSQQGGHNSVTLQYGTDNTATTDQTGSHNTSAIVQIGLGHSQSHTQTGEDNTTSSVQVTSNIPGFSHSRTQSVTVDGRTISVHVEAQN